MEVKQNSKLSARKRKSWSPMQVRFLGTVTDLIKSGGDKLGINRGDLGTDKNKR